jgi:hypothetical protein
VISNPGFVVAEYAVPSHIEGMRESEESSAASTRLEELAERLDDLPGRPLPASSPTAGSWLVPSGRIERAAGLTRMIEVSRRRKE